MSEIDLIRQIADLQRRLAIQETRENGLFSNTWRYPQDFRLTLETGVPVSTTDQLAKTTLYATPIIGGQIALYDGVFWNIRSSTELSISNAGLGNSTVYDVFVYDNAGVPTLELLAWASATARATALVRQNGVLCKTGALTRRYLGTVMTDSAGKFQKRFAGGVTAGAAAEVGVWNYYHRRKERYTIYDNTDTWPYASAEWRSWDNNTQNRLNTLLGVSEDAVEARFYGTMVIDSSVNAAVGIGLDATNAIAADCLTSIHRVVSSSSVLSQTVLFDGHPGIGSHYLQLLEYGDASSITFLGDNGIPTRDRCGAHCDVWA